MIPAACRLLIVLVMVMAGLSTAVAQSLIKYAFVASKNDRNIAIIDVTKDLVVAKVHLPYIPSQIVISDKAGQLIATHADEQRVTIVDLNEGDVGAAIDLPFRPDVMKLNDELGLIALARAGDRKVALITLESMSLEAVIETPEPISDLMFGRTEGRLFIARRDKGVIDIVDVGQRSLVDKITLDDADLGIHNLVRTPGGRTGLALHGESGRLSAIDLNDAEQGGSSKLPGATVQGFPSSDSQHFLIPNGDRTTLSMVSSWTYQEAARLPGPSHASGINFAMFDTVAFVISRQDRAAMAVSLIEDQEPKHALISLPGQPETSLTVDAGRKVYIALSDTGQIAVIDALEWQLTGFIDGVGDEPWAITAAGGLGYCH